MQGPTGMQGPQGLQGIQGEQGLRGIQGEQGPRGIQGGQGPVGPEGRRGLLGPNGPQGEQGIQGQQGIQGIKGEQGLLGPAGAQGVQGIQGIQGPGFNTITDASSNFLLLSDGTVNAAKATSKLKFANDLFQITGNVAIGLPTTSYQLELSTDSAAKPTSSTWTVSSDIRIKQNISNANVDECYDAIKRLTLKEFDWNPNYIPNKPRSLGFIAQEVQEVFPTAVHCKSGYGFPDFHYLDVDQINKAMYGAVVKLMQEVEELKKRLEQIE